MTARVAVVVPVFDQAAFLPRALGSLLAQDLEQFECVVVDDGSTDGPQVPADARVRLLRHTDNRGLGAALNTGLDATTAPVVAYLPADDAWDTGHLSALLAALDGGAPADGGPADGGPADGEGHADLASSGVRWQHGQTLSAPEDSGLQLVQVAHRRTDRRWPERDELEADDLELLLWRHFPARTSTGQVTCTWTDHPGQRSRAIRESADGGLNVFRRRYRVRSPLRLHSRDSGLTDEVALYARFRDRPAPAGGLRVLLVGELAFNPERVLALEQRGHRLFGLWTDDGLGAHTVGPLPFGHVTDVASPEAARALDVDVVYGLLNWRAVPLAARVLRELPHLPFVWHFKEAPQACVRRGTWPDLAALWSGADEVLCATEEEAAWFALALPGHRDPARTHVLDGDLPLAEWFTGERSRRLSDDDGAVHTAVLGRPLGVDADLLVRLGRAGVHVHLHGQVRDHGPAAGWAAAVRSAQEQVDTVHVHPKVEQPDWVRVLSRYDAGWLHRFRATNGGDLRRAVWDDLNAPARIPTYASAGLPMLLQSSPGSTVAAQRLLGDSAVDYDDVDDLVARLTDRSALRAAATASWEGRARFTFDAHVDRLVDVLLAAVQRRAGRDVAGQG
ncbi:MAG: Glycosyl transferase, family 2 [uncultured Frankineae bacterium]|uniref:Glycosyl transferase, family 2 n=1 Tax=uncultured Frankineae bacterium TaxID=437475 RepID=A0A6J4KFH2_9ACTN|nr:MAG: Glycosyl transferase, family 2 [uncultured Frankineae bacterium]